MIETSNSQDPVESTATETANPVETTPDAAAATATPTETPEENLSLKEAILKKGKEAKPAIAEEPAAAVVPVEGAPAVAATPAAYQANFKYKAFGKEKELPEAFRSIVKDEASEKQVKEVFTRADAFDDMKSRFETRDKDFQSVLNEYNGLDKDVKRIMKFRNNGDYDNFFAGLKIPDQAIFNWAQSKIQAMQNGTLDQYEQQSQQRASLISQQDQYTDLQQSYSNQAVQARTMQLDMTLGRPDVSGLATAWDSKVGQIGAFRDLVIQEAANAHFLSGGKMDMSVEQAVDHVMKKFGKFVEAAPQVVPSTVQAQAATAVPQAPAPVAPQAKPVIPNVSGRGASPVKQVPKSLDELRKKSRELRKIEEIPNF